MVLGIKNYVSYPIISKIDKQYVEHNRTRSSTKELTLGEPQG